MKHKWPAGLKWYFRAHPIKKTTATWVSEVLNQFMKWLSHWAETSLPGVSATDLAAKPSSMRGGETWKEVEHITGGVGLAGALKIDQCSKSQQTLKRYLQLTLWWLGKMPLDHYTVSGTEAVFFFKKTAWEHSSISEWCKYITRSIKVPQKWISRRIIKEP